MKPTTISHARIKRIREQGYFDLSDQQISDISLGNRLAYQICTSGVLFGVVLADVNILSVMCGFAFLGVVLPHHPFDYIYNHLIADRIGRPKLPRRSPQLKFACSMATVMLATIALLFASGSMVAGYVLGGSFLMLAGAVSILDLCIPSIIYNKFFLRTELG